MVETIYLDMDGVIANFDKSYHSIYGVNCRDDPKRSNWYEFITKYKGFASLELMPDALELTNYVFSLRKKVSILSCAGRLETFAEVSSQKIAWLYCNGFGHLPRVFTFTKTEKANLASPTSILIDDSIQCIEPFNAAGGVGILHINAADTIAKLEANLKHVRNRRVV